MNAPAALTVVVAYPIPDVWQFYHVSLACWVGGDSPWLGHTVVGDGPNQETISGPVCPHDDQLRAPREATTCK